MSCICMTLKRNKCNNNRRNNRRKTCKKTNKHRYEHGGTLLQNKTFEKILSIGYEFETSGLIKFSLNKHDKTKTLINSDLSLRFLKERMDKKMIKQIDKNYLEVDENAEEEDDWDFSKLPTDEKELWEGNMGEFEEGQAKYKLEREKNKYLDYFYENREGDGDNVKFQITNDLGVTPITNLAKPLCKDLSIPKNEMYYLKTTSDKIYNIHFAKDIRKTTDCETFSDVEYVVTYYNPKISANIILDTFVDACSRIVDHLKCFTENEKVELYIKPEKSAKGVVLGDFERRLYHKPKSNLYYLDAFRYPNLNINNTCFTPQMTFRAKSENCLDIMKQIVISNPSYTMDKDTYEVIEEEYDIIAKQEKIVDRLFERYNKTATIKIPTNPFSETYQILKCYVFFIIYKLYAFIYYHAEITMPITDNTVIAYLKDYTAFNCRHHGNDLYNKIKDILKNKCGIPDKDVATETKKIFMQSDIIKQLYKRENGEYDTHAYRTASLEETDSNFGDPWVSFGSYFDYFEKKDSDWLFDNEYNKYTTMFPLVDNVMIIENRLFKPSIVFYLRNNNFKISHEGCITLVEMGAIVNKLYNVSGLKSKLKKEIEPATTAHKDKHESSKHESSEMEVELQKQIQKPIQKPIQSQHQRLTKKYQKLPLQKPIQSQKLQHQTQIQPLLQKQKKANTHVRFKSIDNNTLLPQANSHIHFESPDDDILIPVDTNVTGKRKFIPSTSKKHSYTNKHIHFE